MARREAAADARGIGHFSYRVAALTFVRRVLKRAASLSYDQFRGRSAALDISFLHLTPHGIKRLRWNPPCSLLHTPLFPPDLL